MESTSAISFPRPTHDQYKKIMESFGMKLSDEDIQKYLTLSENMFKAYDYVLQAKEPSITKVLEVDRSFYYPSELENLNNAWYVKTNIRYTFEGKLSGKKIVLKDNISLAKIPMMNGSDILKGYVPEVDATVVTRILEAGGIIIGKGQNEYMCVSGGSHTGYQGPVHNPHKYGFSAGGSSSGVAVIVASGEADMGIGGDQGGSIRIPSSFCGLFGMKPTHGLVPYTGVIGIERTLDHVGPITKTVFDNALLLEVIAGEDNGLDPRQSNPKISKYTKNLGKSIKGMKIGLLVEGFSLPNMEESVKKSVYIAADKFKSCGAIIEEISIPIHSAGLAIITPILNDGLQEMMMNGNCTGINSKGFHQTSLNSYMQNWQNSSFKLTPSLLIIMASAQWSLNSLGTAMYGKAQNLVIELKNAYDKQLQEYDVLLMPTLPITAKLIPEENNIELCIQKAFEMIGNTAAFDATGHPALNIPCGFDDDGLPIGMMLVGQHYAESTLYQFADQFQNMS